ncbi:MAG: sensor histidine kinase, partial [Deferrisomatales bacterium]
AAACLKLDAVQASLPGDPVGARARIGEVHGILMEEQRGLRAISRRLGPRSAEEEPAGDLALRLAEVCERVGRQWEVAVDLQVRTPLTELPEPVAAGACRLVHEGLVNAARHGAASRVQVEAGAEGGELRLTVADDGRGFGFRGSYDLDELASRGVGPVALRERVKSLGGALRLSSGPHGVCLDISVPFGGGEGST